MSSVVAHQRSTLCGRGGPSRRRPLAPLERRADRTGGGMLPTARARRAAEQGGGGRKKVAASAGRGGAKSQKRGKAVKEGWRRSDGAVEVRKKGGERAGEGGGGKAGEGAR